MKIIEGKTVVDNRGVIKFVNDFDFKDVKRFYMTENFSKNTIRAFHGHLKSKQWVYVPQGSFLIICVRLNEKGHPDRTGKDIVKSFTLLSEVPQILEIPEGYANGFKALRDDSKIMFYSSATIDEVKEDDYRFSWDIFGEEIWEVQNR